MVASNTARWPPTNDTCPADLISSSRFRSETMLCIIPSAHPQAGGPGACSARDLLQHCRPHRELMQRRCCPHPQHQKGCPRRRTSSAARRTAHTDRPLIIAALHFQDPRLPHERVVHDGHARRRKRAPAISRRAPTACRPQAVPCHCMCTGTVRKCGCSCAPAEARTRGSASAFDSSRALHDHTGHIRLLNDPTSSMQRRGHSLAVADSPADRGSAQARATSPPAAR